MQQFLTFMWENFLEAACATISDISKNFLTLTYEILYEMSNCQSILGEDNACLGRRLFKDLRHFRLTYLRAMKV